MRSSVFVQFKLTVENLANARCVVAEMDYDICSKLIADTEIVEAAQMNSKVLRVLVKVILDEDLALADAQELLNEAYYWFSYNDGHQKIIATEMLGIDTEPTMDVHCIEHIPGEDMFETPELWPGELGVVVNHYSGRLEQDGSYSVAREFKEKVEDLGFTFDYGLDAVPFDLRRKVWPITI